MKQFKRVLSLLLIFAMLFGVSGATVLAEESACACEDECLCEVCECGAEPEDEEVVEFTDFFRNLLDWLGDNFGQEIADVFTKVLTKIGLSLAKVGLKIVVKAVVRNTISDVFAS